jgi:hypothetical protein
VIRSACCSLLCVFALSAAGDAQDWAKRMFKDFEYDFGTVARNAKAEYQFELQNIFVEDVHIRSVRSSCGCTTPIITDNKQTLKTWEKGSITCRFNTGSFIGNRSASIIVTIDKPYFAEVQLRVKGNIRSDVVVTPGLVQFGQVDAGQPAEQHIKVSYSGRSSWEIVDVRSAHEHLEVELAERARRYGKVEYDMTVRLNETCPPGYLNDQLTLVTNDGSNRTIPIKVEGNIAAPLTVSPAVFSLGQLKPGETVTKQVIVRSKSAFRVVNVKCDGAGNCFEFEKPTESKTLQVIPVTYTAGEEAGDMTHTIEIETDLGGGIKASCQATATVVAATGS